MRYLLMFVFSLSLVVTTLAAPHVLYWKGYKFSSESVDDLARKMWRHPERYYSGLQPWNGYGGYGGYNAYPYYSYGK